MRGHGLRLKRNHDGPVAKTVASLSHESCVCSCEIDLSWSLEVWMIYVANISLFFFPSSYTLSRLLSSSSNTSWFFLLYFTFIFRTYIFSFFFVLISLYFQLASSKIVITLVPILKIPFSNLYQKIQWLYASQAFWIIQGKLMNCKLHRLK